MGASRLNHPTTRKPSLGQFYRSRGVPVDMPRKTAQDTGRNGDKRRALAVAKAARAAEVSARA